MKIVRNGPVAGSVDCCADAAPFTLCIKLPKPYTLCILLVNVLGLVRVWLTVVFILYVLRSPWCSHFSFVQSHKVKHTSRARYHTQQRPSVRPSSSEVMWSVQKNIYNDLKAPLSHRCLYSLVLLSGSYNSLSPVAPYGPLLLLGNLCVALGCVCLHARLHTNKKIIIIHIQIYTVNRRWRQRRRRRVIRLIAKLQLDCIDARSEDVLVQTYSMYLEKNTRAVK